LLLVDTPHVAAQVLLLGADKRAQPTLVLRGLVQRHVVVHLGLALRDVGTHRALLLLTLGVAATGTGVLRRRGQPGDLDLVVLLQLEQLLGTAAGHHRLAGCGPVGRRRLDVLLGVGRIHHRGGAGGERGVEELLQLLGGHQQLGAGVAAGIRVAAGLQDVAGGVRRDVGLGFVGGTCSQGSVDGWCVRRDTGSSLKGLDPNIPGML